MAELTIQQACDLAGQLYQAKRIPEAEQIYRQILAHQPSHLDAINNLAVIAYETGRHDVAIDLIRRAIALNPNFPAAYCNLGNLLRDSGQFEQSMDAYRRAIALRPAYAEAHNNLATVLRERGRLDEAVAAYRQAITLRPESPEIHFNLGIALAQLGQLDAAINAYQKAIALRPNFPEAYNNLGNVLRDHRRLEESIAAHRQAILLRPQYADAYSNLGLALRDLGQLDDAIAACRQAIALRPNFPEAHSNLGIAQRLIGLPREAVAAFRHAIALNPNFYLAHSNLAFALFNYADSQTIAEEHREWNLKHAEPLRKFIVPHGNDRQPDRRLRIGYVSPDFKNHVAGRFLLPLLEHHDHRQFEVFCYSNVVGPDEFTERFRALADHWLDSAQLGDDPLAQRIRADGIDILIDLAGHTIGNRLLVFARKPAPVQVSYLGYPGSTGVSAIVYRLSDRFADPADSTEVYRLPRSNWCFAKIEEPPPVQPPPAIERGYVTFGSFNTLPKVTETMLQLWGTILREVPNSRLLLKATAFGANSARERVTKALADRGIEADRLSLRGTTPAHLDHLALYGQMDIALDTFPYHGTTTTCDALWMGVPVVTLAGQTHASRVGVSLLSNIGLPELIASSPREYVRIAVELANDVDRLAALRREMRARMAASPLMDAPQFARDVEAAYRQMWLNWCARQ